MVSAKSLKEMCFLEESYKSLYMKYGSMPLNIDRGGASIKIGGGGTGGGGKKKLREKV